MTLGKYVETLVDMLKRNPEIEDYTVIYSSDDEGNTYSKVNFTPTIMLSEGLDNNYLIVKSADKPEEGDTVCIN
tara:strand:+ start:314 stop:535 length:222 start_codon:yes stop_codon:yes gene_type:complete